MRTFSAHNPLHQGVPWLDTPALVSHQAHDKSPCLTPAPAPSPGPKGHQCLCGCHRVWRDEGFGEEQVPAAPEQHIHMPGLDTALPATGSSWDFGFHPFPAQEGQRESWDTLGAVTGLWLGLQLGGGQAGQDPACEELLPLLLASENREKLGLSMSILPWRVKISRGDWRERDEGSSSALSPSLPCSFWVDDSSQGDKGLPGRREVRICCLWETGGLAEKLKAAAGGAWWSKGTLW